jgi:hypothetical protein
LELEWMSLEDKMLLNRHMDESIHTTSSHPTSLDTESLKHTAEDVLKRLNEVHETMKVCLQVM